MIRVNGQRALSPASDVFGGMERGFGVFGIFWEDITDMGFLTMYE